MPEHAPDLQQASTVEASIESDDARPLTAEEYEAIAGGPSVVNW